MAKERLALIMFYAAIMLGGILVRFRLRPGAGAVPFSNEGLAYLFFSALMIIFAAAILVMFKLQEAGKMIGFQISNRYFMFLTPVGIIATVLFSLDMFRACRGRFWLQAGITVILGGMLAFRVMKVWGMALNGGG